jgi:hypothetical protein
VYECSSPQLPLLVLEREFSIVLEYVVHFDSMGRVGRQKERSHLLVGSQAFTAAVSPDESYGDFLSTEPWHNRLVIHQNNFAIAHERERSDDIWRGRHGDLTGSRKRLQWAQRGDPGLPPLGYREGSRWAGDDIVMNLPGS